LSGVVYARLVGKRDYPFCGARPVGVFRATVLCPGPRALANAPEQALRLEPAAFPPKERLKRLVVKRAGQGAATMLICFVY
jgi:hypothetical protein